MYFPKIFKFSIAMIIFLTIGQARRIDYDDYESGKRYRHSHSGSHLRFPMDTATRGSTFVRVQHAASLGRDESSAVAAGLVQGLGYYRHPSTARKVVYRELH